MKKSTKIGIFDSGIGGVTVLREILKILPNEEYIYYSDSLNNPYGDKNKQEIINICDNIVNLFIKENCKAIVIACNTACSVSIDILRKKCPNIIFVGIEPAYKMVHDYNPKEATLVMATKGTIESEKFNILYHKYDNKKTYLLSCVGLADLIEDGNEEQIKNYLNKILKDHKGIVKNVVLGCTHYPLIKQEIEDVLGKINIFEGSNRLAIHLKDVLEKNNLLQSANTSNLHMEHHVSQFEKQKNLDSFLEIKQKYKIHFIDSKKSKEKENRFYKILSDYLNS